MTRPPPPARSDYVYFLRIQTRWMDNDVYGHVNNVVYYAYFDTVINRYLIERGGLDPHGGDIIGLMVSSECRYLAPASYPEELEAGLSVVHLGKTSVRYGVGIFRGDEVLAAGELTHVFVERKDRRPIPPPSHLRAALETIRKPAMGA